MMRILLAGLMFYTSVSFAGPVNKAASLPATKSISQILKEAVPSKTVTLGEVANNLEKMQLSPEYIKLIREKTAGFEKQKIEFDITSPNRFVLRAEGNEVVFEFITKGSDHQIKVNNRLIDIDPNGSLESTMDKIEKMADPKTAGHPLMNLLLPKAHAFFGSFLGIAAIGLGVWGIYTNYRNCSKFKNYVEQCRRTDLSSEQKAKLKDNLKDMQGWFTQNLLSTFCSYKAEATTCYNNLQYGSSSAPVGIVPAGTQ